MKRQFKEPRTAIGTIEKQDGETRLRNEQFERET